MISFAICISKIIENSKFKTELKEMVQTFAQRFMTFMNLPNKRVKRQGAAVCTFYVPIYYQQL